MTTPKFPHAETRLAKYLQKRILEMRPKTQREIAAESGFVNVNMLAMIKSGASRLPLDRVPALAKALDCDARYLFRLALEQGGYQTTQIAIDEIFGAIVSSNERAWLAEIRDASDHTDPALTARSRAALRAIFGK